PARIAPARLANCPRYATAVVFAVAALAACRPLLEPGAAVRVQRHRRLDDKAELFEQVLHFLERVLAIVASVSPVAREPLIWAQAGQHGGEPVGPGRIRGGDDQPAIPWLQ